MVKFLLKLASTLNCHGNLDPNGLPSSVCLPLDPTATLAIGFIYAEYGPPYLVLIIKFAPASSNTFVLPHIGPVYSFPLLNL